MRQSTRLILNTCSTYLRMLVTVSMGLLATRWLLAGVGKLDFGIYNSLIITIGIVLTLSESVSGTTERFVAFEIGRGEKQRQREFFATAVAVMAAVAVLALIIGLPLGRWVINASILSAQADEASNTRAASTGVMLAYALLLVGQSISIVASPFRSMFTAHQAVGLLTFVDTLESALRLAAIVIAVNTSGDKLVWAASCTMIAQGCSCLAVMAFCLRRYPESRIGVRDASRAAFKELGGFTGWAMLGIVSYRIRITGVPLLLASAFGPIAVGAFALAVQLAGYQQNISTAIRSAALPAVAEATGRHDHARVMALIPPINKFSAILASFYMVPLLIETNEVLTFWLGRKTGGVAQFAPETPAFVCIMLLLMALPWLYVGYHAAIFADGRIKHYMVSAVLFEATGLAFAAVLVKAFGAPSWAVPFTAMVTAGLAMTYWVFHISRTLNIPFIDWFKGTWLPVLGVLVPAGAIAYLPHALLPSGLSAYPALGGLPRIVAVGVTYAAAAAPLTWLFAMGPTERGHFTRLIGAALGKLRR